MKPRNLKELGLAIQDLTTRSDEQIKKLKQDYEDKTIEIAKLNEQQPNSSSLRKQAEKLEADYKKSLQDAENDREDKEQQIKKEIYQLLDSKDNEEKVAAFKEEFTTTLRDLDAILIAKVTALNRNEEADVLREMKKIDDIAYDATNTLAQHDMYANKLEIKVTLMRKLSSFTNYDLEKTEAIAGELVDSILADYMAKKKISFELIAKYVEKKMDLAPRNDLFSDLLEAIKKPCTLYLGNAEFLYTNLYNAKKLEFQQHFRTPFYDTYFMQNSARKLIEQQMLYHLVNKKDPHDLYLTFVQLSIDEMKARKESLEQKNEQILIDFKHRHAEKHEEIRAELDAYLAEYYAQNYISPSTIEMLNVDYVKTMYMRIVTSGDTALSNDNPGYNKDKYSSLTTQGVLHALNARENYMHSKAVTISEPAEENHVAKPLSQLDRYRELIDKNKIHQFTIVIQFERDKSIVQQLKKDLESNPAKKNYLDAINQRKDMTSAHRNQMFMKHKADKQRDAEDIEHAEKTTLVR